MKVKSKNYEQSSYCKLKTASTLSFKFYLCAFSFSFSAFCLPASVTGKEISSEQLDPMNFLPSFLAKPSQDANTPNVPQLPMQVARLSQKKQPQTTGTTSVNFAVQVEEELPQSNFTTAPNLNNQLERQLRRTRISASKGQKDKSSERELKRIIEQIRSVEFKPHSETSKPLIVVKPVLPTEPNEALLQPHVPISHEAETIADAEIPEESREKQIEPKLPYEPVSDRTLKMLETLSQHPDQLDNPLELAEVLFLSGHPKEAAVLYREALNRSSSDQAGSAQDRAWILFQLGNCLRDEDPPTAAKMYRQLITEYPNSPWTDLAQTWDKLIDWHQKDEPRALITQNQP